MSYEEQLQDKRWLGLRRHIMSRDLNRCSECGSSHDLNVHHTYYVIGKMAWEYPDHALKTLCRKCHKLWHDKFEAPVLKQNKIDIEASFKFIGETFQAIIEMNRRQLERSQQDGK